MIVKVPTKISICYLGAALSFIISLFISGIWLGYLGHYSEQQAIRNSQVEINQIAQKVRLLLKNELTELDALTKSLALSDDLFGYVKEKPHTDTVRNNLMLHLERKGRFDRVDSLLLYDGKQILIGNNLLEGLEKNEQLSESIIIKSSLNGESKSTFWFSKGSIYSVAIAPISPIHDQSQVKGILLLARKIDNKSLTWYNELISADLSILTKSSVDYASNADQKFTPPLFADSEKALKLKRMLRFRDVIAQPIEIKDLTGKMIGVVWISNQINPGHPLLENKSLSSRVFTKSFILSLCVSIIVYGFLFFLIRRPIRRALLRMASDRLKVEDGEFDTIVDEIISVRKAVSRLQNAVTQSKDVRKTILHSISEGFQLLDFNGNTLEVNPSLCSISGVSREKFLKESSAFFYLNDEGRDLAHEFVELVRKGESNLKRGFESELSWSDGDHKVVKVRLCTVEDDQTVQNHICVFVSTQEVKTDVQFNIHEVGKMTMLVKFAGSIAHNMNNILTGILSAVSLLEKKKVSLEIEAQLLKSMREAVKKGSSLCSELLHMSKVRQVRNSRRPVDICPIVKDVVRMVTELDESKNHELNAMTPETPVLALCDDSGLHHVLLNLVLNSIDAMSSIGKIDVIIESNPDKPDPDVCIRVTDTGVGMKPEVQKMIFNPFFTTKKDRTRKKTFGGSGLGLASALESVESWGGSIECDSELGKGTTFVVKLQLATSAHLSQTENRDKVKLF